MCIKIRMNEHKYALKTKIEKNHSFVYIPAFNKVLKIDCVIKIITRRV